MKRRIIKNNILSDILWTLLCLYIVFSYIIRQLFSLDASTFTGILLFSPLFIMLIIYVISHRGRIRINISAYHVYILLFGVFCSVSALWAEDKSLSLSKGISIVEISIAMLLVTISLENDFSIDRLLKTIMYAHYAVIVYEIAFYGWGYFSQVMADSSRISSDYINSNTLGMCATFAILINIYLLKAKKTNKFTLLLALLSIIIIASSGSRKALVSLVIGMVFFYYLNTISNKKKGPMRYIHLLLLIILFILVGYYILSLSLFSGVMERIYGYIGTYTGQKMEWSAFVRQELLQLGVKLFSSSPWVGIGIDNPRLHTAYIEGYNYYLHNNFIELLASGGLLGFALYYWIYVKILISYFRNRIYNSPQYCMCLTLLIISLILDYGMVSYYSYSTYVFLLLFSKYDERLKENRNNAKKTNIIL